jgi:four helix bundle protein
MFLKLAHTNLEVYKNSRKLILEAYKITRQFPETERYNLTSQIRRACLSVHLNIAEGSTRKSPQEKKRFYEIARGSLIEVDTALDVSVALEFVAHQQLEGLGVFIIDSFKQLTGLINKENPKNEQ